MKYVPFMICVIVFIFTSAGYFITDKKTEKNIWSTFDSKHRVCDCAGGDRVLECVKKTGVKQNPFTVKKKILDM